jgi:DNA-binding transcriptional LysR family regulator
MDLNLVRVFVTIYETGSLTVAAQQLFVTQSAVSQALGRLRDQLDDLLFDRNGRVMRPTPLADAIFPAFRDALGGIARALHAVHGFEASSSDRVFRIAFSELGEVGWLPAVFEAMHAEAPHARIDVVALDVDLLPDWLDRGSVDLAVTPADLSGRFERTFVKSQEYGVVLSRANPLAAGMTLDDYRSAARVAVDGDSGAPLVEAAHARAGVAAAPLVTVQHFATLPLLLSRSTELVATIPVSIAGGWAASWPLVIHPLPFEMPAAGLSLYRRRTSQHPGALEWFYATVARAIAGTAGDFAVIHGDPVHP